MDCKKEFTELKVAGVGSISEAADMCSKLDKIPGVKSFSRGGMNTSHEVFVRFHGRDHDFLADGWRLTDEQKEVIDKRAKEKISEMDEGCRDCMEHIKKWAIEEIENIEKITGSSVDLKTVDRIICWWICEQCYDGDHSNDGIVDPAKKEV